MESSGSREAERSSQPGLAQALEGARNQFAECKGEKTQDGSQHAHGSQTWRGTALWFPKAFRRIPPLEK